MGDEVSRKHDGTPVFRITAARRGLDEDVGERQRRYVILMSVRTVAVILTIVLWNVEQYVAFGALALAILLPYVAAVMANAGRERAPSGPSTLLSAPPSRPAIAPPRRDGPKDARAGVP
ncbi:DUF3099 family protein [Streptomyces sp. 840.1]|uniref:DUF3099 domain-containing protein n=1 Tax=Streptomyces sp. 840.1 TaxID=2485152 RepID=UPI000F476946|nr:DUF3099 domain-containing protein [Streptomyces sp. 840.1]ROQ60136.1 DUF3099 family protein [Streptomyces sp. 840.1]